MSASRDHRADVAERPRRTREPPAEVVVDGVEHDDPTRRRAALARVREGRLERPLDGAVEVGVVADDERVLPAQLHHGLRETASGCSAIQRPVAAEPVNETRSTRASSTSGIPTSGPSPWTTFSTPGGSPASRQSRPSHHAETGVCSDGFSTEPLPQKIDGNAFQATFGSGVLNEIRQRGDADRPSQWSARSGATSTRSSCARTSAGPHPRRRSPSRSRRRSRRVRARAPCQSRPRRSRSPRRGARAGARAMLRTTSPRSTAVRAPHSTCASRAAATAASASAYPDRATRQRWPPSAGRVLSSQAPLAGGRSSPATRFGTSAGITRPTSRRRRRGSPR